MSKVPLSSHQLGGGACCKRRAKRERMQISMRPRRVGKLHGLNVRAKNNVVVGTKDSGGLGPAVDYCAWALSDARISPAQRQHWVTAQSDLGWNSE